MFCFFLDVFPILFCLEHKLCTKTLDHSLQTKSVLRPIKIFDKLKTKIRNAKLRLLRPLH